MFSWPRRVVKNAFRICAFKCRSLRRPIIEYSYFGRKKLLMSLIIIWFMRGNLFHRNCYWKTPQWRLHERTCRDHGFQPLLCFGCRNYSWSVKKYVRNLVIMFGKLNMFLSNGNVFQKHQIPLMKDKYEPKYIILLPPSMLRFIYALASSS